MTLSASEVNNLKHASSHDGVLPLFHERWSPRAFSSTPVAANDLRRVFEAARWAPSSFNEQPWRYIVGLAGTETHKKILESLVEFNQSWAGKTPVLILGVAKTTFSHNNAPNSYAVYDLGAATAYLVLQASALGLATHQMAGFDQGKARKLLSIPEGFDFGSVMALGYQDEPTALPNEQLIKQETAPRTRKAHEEFVFSAWGQPLSVSEQ
jgi:nitroreductase